MNVAAKQVGGSGPPGSHSGALWVRDGCKRRKMGALKKAVRTG